jgi:hypothetical protein
MLRNVWRRIGFLTDLAIDIPILIYCGIWFTAITVCGWLMSVGVIPESKLTFENDPEMKRRREKSQSNGHER